MDLRHRFFNTVSSYSESSNCSNNKDYSTVASEQSLDLQDCNLEHDMAGTDRTSEFVTVVKSFESRQINGGLVLDSRAHTQQTSRSFNTDPSTQQHSNFMRIAKLIANEMSSTHFKLEKLAYLARERSLFNDTAVEAEQLSSVIKSDISSLNSQIQKLQQYSSTASAPTPPAHLHTFAVNVLVALQSKLAAMSAEFKQTLQLRTQSMRHQKQRRDQFGSSTGGSTLWSTPTLGSSMPPALFDSHNRNSVLMSAACPTNTAAPTRSIPSSSSVVLRMPDDLHSHSAWGDHSSNTAGVSHQQQQLMLQQPEQYMDRSEAMRGIESTIVEMGAIFQQLAHMVKEQEEIVQRIDSNVEDTHMHVEAAHSEILKYFRSVSSNRWLMVKVFAILIVFSILIILTMA